jgi:uncharacterized membrane protein HdeD (DUF308 family)
LPSIEDFVQDLFKDVKEVMVPKDKVTELSPGWYVSKYNLPHKGSKKSWRNGRLHAFDMGDHYSVHLDRVDPKDHGIGHLIQDAPFMLFMWVEFRDASRSIHEVKGKDHGSEDRRWVPGFVIGIALLLVGIFIALNSALTLTFIYTAAAGAMLILGLAMIWKGLVNKHHKITLINMLAGSAAIVMSVVIYFLPGIAFWMLLLVMSIWTLGSGLFLVFGRGDKLLFDPGSIGPIIIGIFSLAISILIFIKPVSGLEVVVTLGGILIAFIGLSQIVVGVIYGKHLFFRAKDRA